MNKLFSFLIFFSICFVSADIRPEFPFTRFFENGQRIVGGNEATPNEEPSIVSLHMHYEDGRPWVHHCGGVIIEDSWIITAAHCVDFVDETRQLGIIAGAHNWYEDEETQQRRTIPGEHIYIHPYYLGGASPYDIAMVFVSEQLIFNQYVAFIDLPEPETFATGSVVFFGWGATSSANPTASAVLFRINKQIIPYNVCELAVGGPGVTPLHPNNVCTGPLTGGTGTCHGDGGGPLIQGRTLIGLATWFFAPCGTVGAPSVFTRVSAYNDWFFSIIIEHGNK